MSPESPSPTPAMSVPTAPTRTRRCPPSGEPVPPEGPPTPGVCARRCAARDPSSVDSRQASGRFLLPRGALALHGQREAAPHGGFGAGRGPHEAVRTTWSASEPWWGPENSSPQRRVALQPAPGPAGALTELVRKPPAPTGHGGADIAQHLGGLRVPGGTRAGHGSNPSARCVGNPHGRPNGVAARGDGDRNWASEHGPSRQRKARSPRERPRQRTEASARSGESLEGSAAPSSDSRAIRTRRRPSRQRAQRLESVSSAVALNRSGG